MSNTTCSYCGIASYGRGCPHSPLNESWHIHEGASFKHCIYCGSEDYGQGCFASPNGIHKHGHDGVHCIYCGYDQPNTCTYSPSGRCQT